MKNEQATDKELLGEDPTRPTALVLQGSSVLPIALLLFQIPETSFSAAVSARESGRTD
jgi:hypothetical protein